MEAERQVRAVQGWMALDLWCALGRDPRDFSVEMETRGWAEVWDELLSMVRACP